MNAFLTCSLVQCVSMSLRSSSIVRYSRSSPLPGWNFSLLSSAFMGLPMIRPPLTARFKAPFQTAWWWWAHPSLIVLPSWYLATLFFAVASNFRKPRQKSGVTSFIPIYERPSSSRYSSNVKHALIWEINSEKLLHCMMRMWTKVSVCKKFLHTQYNYFAINRLKYCKNEEKVVTLHSQRR